MAPGSALAAGGAAVAGAAAVAAVAGAAAVAAVAVAAVAVGGGGGGCVPDWRPVGGAVGMRYLNLMGNLGGASVSTSVSSCRKPGDPTAYLVTEKGPMKIEKA